MEIKMLNEMKDLLVKECCKDKDCISLYDVLTVVKNRRNKYDDFKWNFLKYIAEKMGVSFLTISPYSIYDFDFKNNELNIGYNFKDDATFTKVDGDLIIKSSETFKAQELLSKCGEKISDYYDSCLQYQSLFMQCSKDIQSVNSDFLVDIDAKEISISSKFEKMGHTYDFKLSINFIYGEYEYKCMSNTVISAFRNNEDEIFKRIFVRIEDCPKWTWFLLYELRKEQLEKNAKKEKRRELRKKIFPFIKK